MGAGSGGGATAGFSARASASVISAEVSPARQSQLGVLPVRIRTLVLEEGDLLGLGRAQHLGILQEAHSGGHLCVSEDEQVRRTKSSRMAAGAAGAAAEAVEVVSPVGGAPAGDGYSERKRGETELTASAILLVGSNTLPIRGI